MGNQQKKLKKKRMKTLNPYSSSFQSTSTTKKQGHQFWGINLSNIPSSITDSEIRADFKQYGDIFNIKSVATNSINIIFSSPKKSSSITDIISQQTKFKVSPLESKQLPAKSKKTSVAKLSLLSGSNTKSTYKFNPNPPILQATNLKRVRVYFLRQCVRVFLMEHQNKIYWILSKIIYAQTL